MKSKQTTWFRLFLPKETFEALTAEANRCGFDGLDCKDVEGLSDSPHAKWLGGREEVLANTMANLLLEETLLLAKTSLVQEALESFPGWVDPKGYPRSEDQEGPVAF